jgi:hypothetical protein
MTRLLRSDLLCFGAMVCVGAGMTLNIVYLQVLQGGSSSPLVLAPVLAGLSIVAGVPLVRAALHLRHKNWLEGLGAGAVIYLAGSALLSGLTPFLPQQNAGL